MNPFALALRNILRNRRRSIITMLAIVVGASTMLLFGGYVNSISHGLETGIIASGGHMQVQRTGYFEFGRANASAYGIANYDRLMREIDALPELRGMITVMSPQLHVSGLAGNARANTSKPVTGIGLVPADMNRMSLWNDYDFPPNTKRPLAALEGAPSAAIIGHGLASLLQMCEPLGVQGCAKPPPELKKAGAGTPADIFDLAATEQAAQAATLDGAAPTVELLAATASGAPNVAQLKVAKAEVMGVKEVDDSLMLMHLRQAQRLVFGGGREEASAILIQLHHTASVPFVKERLERMFRAQGLGLAVHDFKKLNPQFGQITSMFGAIFLFISLLMATVVLFTTVNTMNMAVVERTTEIGTLRAMGVRRSGILKIFLAEGFLIGLLGSATGVLLSLAIALGVNHGGFHWLPPGAVDPVPLLIQIWGQNKLILITGISLILVASLSAMVPARKAANMEIVEALRHV